MKTTLLGRVVALAFIAAFIIRTPALAAPYNPSEAAAHIGETATVEGIVSQTHIDGRSGVGFINMGGRYPNITFQGFIPRSAIGRFGNIGRFDGRKIGITGVIRDYRGTPEIILTDPSQIGGH